MMLEPENNELQSTIDTPTKRKESRKKRPDGSNVERYIGCEKWTYKRWAWEFLRRNENFQQECKKIESGGTNEDRLRIARDFGLKKYKSFREFYSSGTGRPVFSVGMISSWSHLIGDNEGNRLVGVHLDGGQVLIRFDLSSALLDKKILAKQIQNAQSRLERRLTSYAKIFNARVKNRQIHVSVLGQYLRMLDSVASGRSQFETGLLIAPDKARKFSETTEKERHELAPGFSRKMKAAVAFTTDLYRCLAIIKGRPNIESIPLIEEKPSSSRHNSITPNTTCAN